MDAFSGPGKEGLFPPFPPGHRADKTSFKMNEPLPSAKPQRSLHILCIDDDEQILEMMKACLAHYGHQVRTASGGKYGLELFCTAILKSEPYDAVITDLGMPDIDGYQVSWAIKIESPNTPVILLTAWGANVKDDVAISSTVNAVVSKPPQIQQLNDLLLRLAG
jgi:CheY-like chemotaxis protein